MSATKFETVKNEKSPDFGSHFSLATKYNGKLYVSGMVGKDPATNQLVEGGVGPQTTQTLQNISDVLEAGGSNLNNIIKTQIFLVDMKDYAEMNKAWDAVIKGPNKTSRTTVAVSELPYAGARVEIQVNAIVADSKL